MLSPTQAEIGTKIIFFVLNPTLFKKININSLIYLYLSYEYSILLSSILLTQTTIFLIPKENAMRECTLVCPSLLIPA